MVLTRGDDFPIHQTPEPVAYAGTDRNFYDRYFFNGYASEAGDLRFFGAALGIYPHLNIADAAFVVVRDGVQTAIHASRHLNMERMDLTVGPISVAVEAPLERLRVTVDAPGDGVRADIVFSARAAPVEEPRFVRRNGPRTFMDYTRLTQNGRYEGFIELDGVREEVSGFIGTRDRSWGVRPIGARDAQELAPPAVPQFFWLWSPCSFEDGSLFFHTNDDAGGRPWNRRAVWSADGSGQKDHLETAAAAMWVEWASGTRNARGARLELEFPGGGRGEARFTPVLNVPMLGLGYGHPKWGHGLAHGPLSVEREDLRISELDPRLPHHLHVQALSEVVYQDPAGRERRGRGVLEQLALGPHAPSGFAGLMDPAP